MQSPVGAIGLECLMNRANILFTNGYRFKGELNLKNLEASYTAITSSVEKFAHQLHFESQNRFHWKPAGPYRKPFEVLESDDLDQAFKDLCKNSLSLLEEGGHCPMVLSVILDKTIGKEFIIAQTTEHTYLDARGSESIFNKILEYYNALCRGELDRLPGIVDSAKDIKTLSGQQILQILSADGHDHEKNVEGLVAYPVADVGEYAIPLRAVPDCLENYKKQRFAPIVEFLDIKKLLDQCRARYPQVTQNSVICAALAKGFYNINRAVKKKPEEHLISFKMLSDLLAPELRQKYSGNYIAFVPVSVDGEKPIEEIAKQVHDRIREFKTTKLDVSIFKLTEEAVEQALVGTADDALSFVVTNWNNYRYLNSDEYLHGCQSVRHQSGVNIEPRDALGAILVNRPILVINMSAPDEVCLSFFPSLRSEEENLEVAKHIGDVINHSGQ